MVWYLRSWTKYIQPSKIPLSPNSMLNNVERTRNSCKGHSNNIELDNDDGYHQEDCVQLVQIMSII